MALKSSCPPRVVFICLAFFLAGLLWGRPGAFSPGLSAQSPDVPALGPQTWQVLVDNVSLPGHNWSFEAFYPSHLEVHPGDTVTFTLAPNPNAVHTVNVLGAGVVPEIYYAAVNTGFIQPNQVRQ